MIKRKKLLTNIAISLLVSGFLSGLFIGGYFAKSQFKVADRLFLPSKTTGQVLIVAIDNKSISKIGQWPWPRKVIALLIDSLGSLEPSIIGVDINFSEESQFGKADDEALADALSSNNVVLPKEASSLSKIKIDDKVYFRADNLISPIDVLAKQAISFGHVNVFPDNDGIIRNIPNYFNWDGQRLNSFATTLVKESGIILKTLQPNEPMLKVNFIGPSSAIKYISAVDVIDKNVEASEIKDKIIIIGATSADLHDTQTTPTSRSRPMPGAEIHANAIETIISGKYIFPVSDTWTLFVIFLMSFLALAIVLKIRRLSLLIFFAGISLISYNLISLLAFEYGKIFNLIYPNLAFVLSFIASTLFQYFSEGKEKDFLRRSFQQYLSPSVIDQIIDNPDKLKLGGDKKDLTIFFSDIRGFTTLTEATSAEELVSFLNRYFTAVTEVILKNKGVVDKFIGDAVMAFWGAPNELDNHALWACRASLEIKAKLVEFQKEWKEKGINFNIGIGINSGEVIVGNMGSDQRFDYTVIGDNVNVASRLEGLNKQFSTNIIVSLATLKKLAKSAINKVEILEPKEWDKFDIKIEGNIQFLARCLGEVMVKGKTKPILIFELS
ncbi:MAG: hypothetical protein COU81_01530 [Candidatus Portnoybacteria bacterium CG10_big_fil_rev_8_21_14_0_10_36_7]|uniref:Guanylate cyclase domain-containing protein n=1 Tax=Candidatus Portnoybacteria bacterium CG10_big_fil_rev_8_21_14_0_10_36_7 TaxID=1974812 RepID=A0A2M8KEE2_9BACT|nr:MAG: hypothetical protein COU81_01530 [Candidatus Portnoybacteria bacterium CG10_big_fil_rev_8_21_14_0_10_36_7]